MNPNGFDLFWGIYPRKQGKGLARKTWAKIKGPAFLLETILKAVEDQKKSEQWQRGYVPLPVTWLNQERWDDEPWDGAINSNRIDGDAKGARAKYE